MQAKKILLLGSGPVTIAQAGEFDYSGSQALRAFQAAGYRVILVNPNIASLQTDKENYKKVYLCPIAADYVCRIIAAERPSFLACGFGGQTALNCAFELARRGVLWQYGIKVLGTALSDLEVSEDRAKFAAAIKGMGFKTAPYIMADNMSIALKASVKIGFPLVIRCGYALGGLSSALCLNKADFNAAASCALKSAPQIIIEQSLYGFKEIEFEILRDSYGFAQIVCGMENIDPVGIHTGDSIVVSPCQTLSAQQLKSLEDAAIKIVSGLNIVGECNIQFALSGDTFYVVEVNARLSRSSALASKATGVPIAYIAAQLILGAKLNLDIKKPDYVIVKMPRWDFDKFPNINRRLGTQMKSTGEVMAIASDFKQALQKAVRMVLEDDLGLSVPVKTTCSVDDKRIFWIYSALKNGVNSAELARKTKIDIWFINRLLEIALLENFAAAKTLTKYLLLSLKLNGFSDAQIAQISKKSVASVRAQRLRFGLKPSARKINKNYIYLTYGAVGEKIKPSKPVIILGGGAYRIGSSLEFDWCVSAAASYYKRTASVVSGADAARGAVIVNCNPETVSTDYYISDRLYFEELSIEPLLDIAAIENPLGFLVSMGGQRPNNLAADLEKGGQKILGSGAKIIESIENRNKFSAALKKLKINQPDWAEVKTLAQAKLFIKSVKYPVIARPSYVLSGTDISVLKNDKQLKKYMAVGRQVTLSKFIQNAAEYESDCVSQNGCLKLCLVSKHIEFAGVHGGDATLIFPCEGPLEEIKKISVLVAKHFKISGSFNLQFLFKDGKVYVVECNCRASRTFPFISKVSDINLAEAACKAMEDKPLKVTVPQIKRTGVKAAVFSFNRLGFAPQSGVKMLSTGEVAAISADYNIALLTAFAAAGISHPTKGVLVSPKDKKLLPLLAQLNMPVIISKDIPVGKVDLVYGGSKVVRLAAASSGVAFIDDENKLRAFINALTSPAVHEGELSLL